MNSPCKDCPNRTQGCHTSCEAYKAYHEERELISRERAKRNDFARYISDNRKRVDRETEDLYRRHRIKRKHL